MLPGGTEFAENAYHLTIHSDFAHDQPLRPGHQPFDPEHGCGGGFHLCSCCHTQPSLSIGKIDIASDEPPGNILPPSTFLQLPQGFSALLENPPRA